MNSLEATNRCVKCGLCLPHCPTFQLTGIETESPRGRISLMQMLQTGQVPAAGLQQHLENCLQCRACEAMCPSRVPFGRLMDAALARITAGENGRRGDRIPAITRFSSTGKRLFSVLAAFYRRYGLQFLARRSRLLPKRWRRLDRLLTRTPRLFVPPGPAPQANREHSRIQLFPGCAGSILDADALDAAVRLLSAAGYAVEVPRNLKCCGALHQHRGETESARRMATHNIRALASNELSHITSVVSGCTAQLKEYSKLYPEQIATGFAHRVDDVHRLLLDAPELAGLRFEPLDQTAVVHFPCTQRNVLKETGAIVATLRLIPNLHVSVLDEQPACCGAAGDYCITHAEQADELLDRVLRPLAGQPPPILLTSNVGCALHLSAGFEERGWSVEVLHPLTLLARQLRDAPANLG